jgi:alpha-tubulin suppressor-like RCC1 family protein
LVFGCGSTKEGQLG